MNLDSSSLSNCVGKDGRMPLTVSLGDIDTAAGNLLIPAGVLPSFLSTFGSSTVGSSIFYCCLFRAPRERDVPAFTMVRCWRFDPSAMVFLFGQMTDASGLGRSCFPRPTAPAGEFLTLPPSTFCHLNEGAREGDMSGACSTDCAEAGDTGTGRAAP